MKLVCFNRAMAPYVAGETRIVPDDVAARLVAEGVVMPDPAEWPPKPEVKPVPKPDRRALRFGRERLQGYPIK